MNTWNQYLNKLNISPDEVSVDSAFLHRLHERHVLTIPFEDIDIHTGTPLSLDPDRLLDKVVLRNRGGFCYELNYLFCELLKHLGFKAHIISSRIYKENGELAPEYDHMSIVVTLDDRWLIDIGYGSLFIEPVKIEDGYISQDRFQYYKINYLGDDRYILTESKDGQAFSSRYQFSLTERTIDDFKPQCHYKQHHPDSYFVNHLICTLPTQDGRITVLNNRLIDTRGGQRKEHIIQDEQELKAILANRFNIHLEKPLPIPVTE